MKSKVHSLAAYLLCAATIASSSASCCRNLDRVSKPEYRFSRVVVYEVAAHENTVTFCDTDGDLWDACVENHHGFEIGDKYILTFDNMGTPDIYDDKIVDIF